MIDLPLERLIAYARNPRKNTAAVATVAASLKEFGWQQPIVVGEEMVILAGHTRLEAARLLGLTTALVHIARGLTPAQAKAYRLMDNRAAENAEWDEALLGLELGDPQGESFDLALTGFDDAELNKLLAGLGNEDGSREGENEVPETPVDPVTRPGDLWLLGPHRLIFGDSTVATDVERVLGGVTPLLMVSDPPYGVEYDPGWRNKADARCRVTLATDVMVGRPCYRVVFSDGSSVIAVADHLWTVHSDTMFRTTASDGQAALPFGDPVDARDREVGAKLEEPEPLRDPGRRCA